MTKVIIACLIVDVIGLISIVALVLAIMNLHNQIRNEHEKEKADLKQSNKYHCDQLKKRSGENVDSDGYDLGERGNKR